MINSKYLSTIWVTSHKCSVTTGETPRYRHSETLFTAAGHWQRNCTKRWNV